MPRLRGYLIEGHLICFLRGKGMDEKIYDITKEYTEMFKVVVYRNGYTPPEIKERDKRIKSKQDKEDSIQRSVRRSRSVINDYVHCNEFELFVTFTFDPRKVDRYDLDSVYSKMQGWLFRKRLSSPDFRYIIVPERHKDGAIHFHALLGGYDGKLIKTNVIQNNKRVYNIANFKLGFTNAQHLDDDRQKTIAYMCKYITKDMELVHNRRRYWCSKNLQKPVKFYNSIYSKGIASLLSYKTQTYETEYNVIYEVPKDLFV